MNAEETKIKILSPKEYLDMIRPYLRDNKASMKLRVYLGNEIIDYETQLGEWKIQCKSILFLLKTLKKFVL